MNRYFFIIFYIAFLSSQLTGQTAADSSGTVTDIDGNVYPVVNIGDQNWMAENLKVTRYRNGDHISTGYLYVQWANLTTGAYAAYYNDTLNVRVYGYLYNWYAVDDDRGICPEGWHVPSEWDFEAVELSAGMTLDQCQMLGWRGVNTGGKFKSTGISHWREPNEGAVNSTGFSALPGGMRSGYNGSFDSMGFGGYFWTSTDDLIDNASYRILSFHQSGIFSQRMHKRTGMSIRCVQDDD